MDNYRFNWRRFSAGTKLAPNIIDENRTDIAFYCVGFCMGLHYPHVYIDSITQKNREITTQNSELRNGNQTIKQATK